MVGERLSHSKEDDTSVDYSERRVNRMMATREDIYFPSKLKVKMAMAPYLEHIKSNPEQLLRLGESIEKDVERGIRRAVSYFSNLFGIDDDINIEIYDAIDDSDPCGEYDFDDNTIRVYLRESDSVANILNTVAHEVRHACQQRCIVADNRAGKTYATNLKYYFEPSWDHEMYAIQRIEQEAFMIGDTVSEYYWKAYLNNNPEDYYRMLRKYNAWQRGKYDPGKSADGYDEEALRQVNRRNVINNSLAGRIGAKVFSAMKGKNRE